MNLIRKVLYNKVWLLTGILVFAGIVRLLTMGSYPLFDTTEARYAEIARKIIETKIWVMPQYDYGVPFWAKPPLSMWSTALSMEVLGINEFGARISSFIFSLGMLWLVYDLAKKQSGRDYALAASAVLATVPVFFIISGGVMTDPAMAFATTLAMAAFWNALSRKDKRTVWGYTFFISIGLGLLAKGPVAVVLTFFPIIIWATWKKKWREVWDNLPWIKGSLLALAIAVPWYAAAEYYSPGFLRYFLIGEHIMRFIHSGWQGDLYGHEHSVFRGAIWVYWIGATFPWCIFLFKVLFREKSKRYEMVNDDWQSYLALWTITPMIFFTLAGNILWTYVLPGIPAFSLLMGEIIEKAASEKAMKKWALSAGLFVPVAFIAFVVFSRPYQSMQSQKELVEGYYLDRHSPASKLIYLYNRPYSAEFYSNGKALLAPNLKAAKTFIESGAPDFFVVQDGRKLPENIKEQLTLVHEYGKFQLMEEKLQKQSLK